MGDIKLKYLLILELPEFPGNCHVAEGMCKKSLFPWHHQFLEVKFSE